MESTIAIAALSALAQPTRLDVFRLLVRHEPAGLPAGEVARRLGVRANTMSTHLGILTHARLVTVERRSRSIVYRAALVQLRAMIAFLIRDCCAGRPEMCDALLEELLPGTPMKEHSHA